MLSQDLQLKPNLPSIDSTLSTIVGFFSRRASEMTDFDTIHNLSQPSYILLLNAILSGNSFKDYKEWLEGNTPKNPIHIPLQLKIPNKGYLHLLNEQDLPLKRDLVMVLNDGTLPKNDSRIIEIFGNEKNIHTFISENS